MITIDSIRSWLNRLFSPAAEPETEIMAALPACDGLIAMFTGTHIYLLIGGDYYLVVDWDFDLTGRYLVELKNGDFISIVTDQPVYYAKKVAL